MDKEEVIKTTLELLKEKKLERTSIGKITKKLESSPGSLYYHFKNKNEIYEKAASYSYDEIMKHLFKIKLGKNVEKNLFILTIELIKFLESREEILYFLISVKGSYYLEKKIDFSNKLEIFKEILLKKKGGIKKENVGLKLRMFWGSICELLYISKFLENRNLNVEELEEICVSFWGERYNIYKQDSLELILNRV